MRRGICAVTILAALAISATTVFGRSEPARTKGVKTRTTTVSKTIKTAGTYTVTVTVRARKKPGAATVFFTGEPKQAVSLKSTTYTKLSYNVPVTLETVGEGKHRKTKPARLTARAVSRRRVLLTMTIAPYVKPTPVPTPTPAPAVVVPPAPVLPPYVGTGPYSTVVYDTQNGTGPGSPSFGGAAGAAPTGWTAQTGPGECDPGAINYNTSGTQNASDDGNGDLVITAKQQSDEDYPYTSAQLTSSDSFQYGAIEASIKMPPGE
jgi:hypothetical protein